MAIVLEEQEHQKPLQQIFAEICPQWHARFQKKKLTTKEKFALGFEGAMCAIGEAHQWSGNYAFRRRRKYCQNCVRYSSMFPYAYNRKIRSDGYVPLILICLIA